MPGNIGWQGLVIIVLVLLVVFGPKRLPELGRSLDHKDDRDDSELQAPEHEIGRSPSPEPEALPEAREHDKVV